MDAALTSPELTALRGSGTIASGAYLSYLPLDVIATARVNQAITGYQTAQLTVNTTSAEWLTAVEKGMTVWIGSTAGARDRGTYRVRAVPDATTLFLGEISWGDPGLSVHIAPSRIANGDYVTVIDDSTLWSVFPRITYSGGIATFYKDYNEAYSTQNETAIPFAVRLGPNRADWVDAETGLLNHSFNPETYDTVSDSYTWLWTIPAGVTIVVGDTTTKNIEIDCEPGHHKIKLQVTHSSGAVVNVLRHIWAHDPVEYPPIELKSLSITLNPTNPTTRISLANPSDLDDIIDGSLVTVWTDPTFSGEDIPTATKQVTGFLRTVNVMTDPDYSGVQFQVLSAMEEMKNLVAFSQGLYYKANPTNWQEVIAALMHIDFFLFYLVFHHSTVLSLFDYNPSGLTSLKSFVWVSNPGNLNDQLIRAGARVRANVGQASDGSFWVRSMLDTATESYRATLVNRVTIISDDVEEVNFDLNTRPQFGKSEVLAVQQGTSQNPVPCSSHAYGKVGGQGTQTITEDNLIVVDQTDADRIAGCLIVSVNNPLPKIELLMARSFPVLEPAINYSVFLDLTDVDTPGITLNHACQIKTITHDYQDDGSIKTRITLSAITNGNATPGQPMPIIIGNDQSGTGTTPISIDPVSGIQLPSFPPIEIPSWPAPVPPSWPTPWPPAGEIGTIEPEEPVPVVLPQKFFAAETYGLVQRGTEFDKTASLVNWELINDGLDAYGAVVVYDGCIEPTNTNVRYLLTDLGLFKCTNIWGVSPIWKRIATNTKMTGSSSHRCTQILMHRAKPGWIWCMSGYTVCLSKNYGATFTQQGIDPNNPSGPFNYSDAYPAGDAPFLAIGRGYTSASGYLFSNVNVYDGTYHVYPVYSPDWGESWDWLITASPHRLSSGIFTSPAWCIPRLRKDGTLNLADANIEWYAPHGHWGAGNTYLWYNPVTFGSQPSDMFSTGLKASITVYSDPELQCQYPSTMMFSSYDKKGVFYLTINQAGFSNTQWTHRSSNSNVSAVHRSELNTGGRHIRMVGYTPSPDTFLVYSPGYNGVFGARPGYLVVSDGVTAWDITTDLQGEDLTGPAVLAYADLNDPYQ